jgi:hypothetical protein
LVEKRRRRSDAGAVPEIHPRQEPVRAHPDLTPEQQAESDRIFAALQQACQADLRALADLLASKADADLFGATEFQARDRVLPIAAKALQAALEGREKGGTTAPAAPARTAARRPSSSAGRPSPS